jgi:hypothetical protein
MASNGVDPPKPSAPERSRHQIHRSLSELSSPVRLHRQHHQNHHQQRRERQNDERPPLSAQPNLQQARRSLDLPRSEGGVTPSMTPAESRRGSVMISGSDEAKVVAALAGLNQRKASGEEGLRKEREKAVSRAA